MFEMYVDSDGKKLRCGYTTGSCSAGAAKAAAMILYGKADDNLNEIEITSPKNITINMPVRMIHKDENSVQCEIIKFSGDDPDITNGIEIRAEVRKIAEDEEIVHELHDYDEIENAECIYLKAGIGPLSFL